MRTVYVKIADERLAELDRAVASAIAGEGIDWYLRLSAPEVAVLVGAYRTLVAAAEAFDTGDYDVMEDALRAVPGSSHRQASADL